MRLTGGQLRGRRLRVPKGARPTSDRVRESLFSALQHRFDAGFHGLSVLDLFAGSGALGFEALSRGAADVLAVESAPAACRQLRENAEALGVETSYEVLRSDAYQALRRLGRQGRRFDLLFADPPYAQEDRPRLLRGVAEAGLLTPRGLVAVEHPQRAQVVEIEGFTALDERRYGDTAVTLYAGVEPAA